MQWVGVVAESGEVLKHYHHMSKRTDTSCCHIVCGFFFVWVKCAFLFLFVGGRDTNKKEQFFSERAKTYHPKHTPEGSSFWPYGSQLVVTQLVVN